MFPDTRRDEVKPRDPLGLKRVYKKYLFTTLEIFEMGIGGVRGKLRAESNGTAARCWS